MIPTKALKPSGILVMLLCGAFTVPSLIPDKDYKQWHISELSDSLRSSGKPELVFMNEKAMMGVYLEVESSKIHNRESMKDDLYYVHDGMGSISINGKQEEAKKGSVLYVPAKSAVAITGVAAPLKIVITSMTNGGSLRTGMESHSREAIENPRVKGENSWNPFIRMSNVIFGMYMLPLELDGDNRLVHTWQELNIVTSGSSKFKMDTGEIDVIAGSIFFVEKGNGHFFTALDEDIDILILWEQP